MKRMRVVSQTSSSELLDKILNEVYSIRTLMEEEAYKDPNYHDDFSQLVFGSLREIEKISIALKLGD